MLYDGYGNLIATYEYDAWGRPYGVKDANGDAITSETHVARLNPYRYRGYYYDEETGFYYCGSRYYDPIVCRWLNADGYAGTGQGILGYNMFAYCLNDPIQLLDINGNLPRTFSTYVVDGAHNPYFTDTSGYVPFWDPLTNRRSGEFHIGKMIFGKGQLIAGYQEVNRNLQFDPSETEYDSSFVGVEAKLSDLHADGFVGIKDDYTTATVKASIDGLCVDGCLGMSAGDELGGGKPG